MDLIFAVLVFLFPITVISVLALVVRDKIIGRQTSFDGGKFLRVRTVITSIFEGLKRTISGYDTLSRLVLAASIIVLVFIWITGIGITYNRDCHMGNRGYYCSKKGISLERNVIRNTILLVFSTAVLLYILNFDKKKKE